MKAFRRFQPSWSLVISLGLLLSEAAMFAGEKIEFSPPTSTTLFEKPLTDRDINPRSFNFQKERSSESDLSASGMVPPADQGARARAFIDLMERNGGFSTDPLKGSGLSLDDVQPSPGDRSGPLDDLFQRPDSRPDRGTGRMDNPSPSGLDEGRLNREPSFGSALDGTRTSLNADNFVTSAETSPKPFLQSLDIRNDARDLLGNRKPARPGANERQSTSWRGSSLGGRETDEFRQREERMDTFRRMLQPGFIASESVAGASLKTTPGVSLNSVLTPGQPATSRGSFQTPESAAQSMIPGRDDLGANPRAATPFRPFDLGPSTMRGGGNGTRTFEADAVAPTPMELFHRKHDTRIPARAF